MKGDAERLAALEETVHLLVRELCLKLANDRAIIFAPPFLRPPDGAPRAEVCRGERCESLYWHERGAGVEERDALRAERDALQKEVYRLGLRLSNCEGALSACMAELRAWHAFSALTPGTDRVGLFLGWEWANPRRHAVGDARFWSVWQLDSAGHWWPVTTTHATPEEAVAAARECETVIAGP